MPPAPARNARAHPPTRIVAGVLPSARTPAHVARRLRDLLDAGARLRPAGRARRDPDALLALYPPRHEIVLFDATYLLTGLRFNEALGFFVAYVVLGEHERQRVTTIHPRILYKDSSLVWRVASHFVHDHREYWIGKGDVRRHADGDDELLSSAEETTNLPYEIQTALDVASRRARRRRDERAIELVLREGPTGRIAPYADFVAPRREAAARWRVNGGRPVARFTRHDDPTSLRFAPGFEPDLRRGVIERAESRSEFFGGMLRKFRILSTNRRIQYQFVASPTHAWVNPPQTLTTTLTSYGVRPDDVIADERVFVPGYEYHDPDGGDGGSQIPCGFAGAAHPRDPARADAAAWNEALPVVRAFRRTVLGGARRP